MPQLKAIEEWGLADRPDTLARSTVTTGTGKVEVNHGASEAVYHAENEKQAAQKPHARLAESRLRSRKTPRPHLLEWVRANRHQPYPSLQEKLALAKVEQLTKVQLDDWFINYRARVNKPG